MSLLTKLDEEKTHQFLKSLRTSNLTQREKKGILLEFAVQKALSLLNLNHQSNPPNPEEWKKTPGNGVDHEVTDKRALIEDKNLGRKSSYYPSFFKIGVSSRFQKIDPVHKNEWIHVVSKADGYSSKVWTLCKNLRIRVVSVGFVVTSEVKNILKAIQVLVKKFMLIFRIRKTHILNELEGVIEGVLKGFISLASRLNLHVWISNLTSCIKAKKPPPIGLRPTLGISTSSLGLAEGIHRSCLR